VVDTLENFRKARPELRDWSDAELATALYKKYGEGMDKFDFALQLKGKGPRLGPVEAGTASVKSSAQTAYAKGLEVLGFEDAAKAELEEAQARQRDVAERYKREVPTAADISGIGSAARYAYETAAENVTGMAVPLVGGAVGAIGGTLVGGPVGGVIGGIGGGIAASLPMTLGENIQEQMAGGKTLSEVELKTALPAAVASAGLEATINRFLPGVGKAVAGKMFARAARQGIEGGLVEAGTEAVQEALTIAQADPEKLFDMSPEIQARITEAAIAGGILGTGVGGVSGGLRAKPLPPEEVPVTTTVVTPSAPAATPTGEVPVLPTGEGPEFLPTGPEVTTAVDPTVGTTTAGTTTAGTTTAVDPTVGTTTAGTTTAVDPTVGTTTAGTTTAGTTTAVDPTVGTTTTPAAPLFKLASDPKEDPDFQVKPFTLEFANDVDKALYFTSMPNKSTYDLQYRDFLKNVGFTEPQIEGYGKGLSRSLLTSAQESLDKGITSGPLTVDYMRTFEPQAYTDIVSKAAIPEAPAQPPVTIAQPPVVDPAAVSTGVTEVTPEVAAATSMEFIGSTEAELDKRIPGVTSLLKEIQTRLYPNTKFTINSRGGLGKNTFGEIVAPQYISDPYSIKINLNAIEKIYKVGNKTKIMHTLMHELSHALEVEHFRYADQATKNAIIQQFRKERSTTAFQRYLIMRSASVTGAYGSPTELADALKAANLTQQEYDKLLKSEANTVKGLIRNNVSTKYMREFSEWVAEKGAQWLSRELAGRIPETVYEKFQKSVLDSLRNLYATVTRLMGITPQEGAFEKMIVDVWGKTDTSLQRALTQKGTTFVGGFGNVLPGDPKDRTSGGGRKINRVADVPPVDSAASEAMPGYSANGDRIVSKEHPLTKEDIVAEDSNPAVLTLEPGLVQSYAHFMSAKKPKGLWSRLLDFITGRVGNESHAQAILRNTVASQLPFMTRAGYEGVGQTIERMQNVQGRVAGLLNFGPLVYNKDTGEITFDENIGGLINLFRGIGNKRAPELQRYEIAQRELDLRSRGRAGLSVLDEVTKKPLTTADLQRIVDNTPADIKEVAKKHMEFNRKMVQFSVDTGVIPQEKADEWLTMMYTPFYRVAEDDPDSNLTLSPSITQMVSEPARITAFNKALQTGDAIKADLYGNILKNYSIITASSLKNIAYNAVAKAAGIGDPKVNEGLGFDQTIIQKVGKPGKNIITYRVDGGDQYMLVNDVPMLQALAALSPKQMNAFVTAASKLANVLRTGVTIAPGFQIANLWRGIIDTHIKTGMPLLQVVTGTFKGLKQVYMKGASYQAITAATGFGGYGYGSGYRDMASYMERVYETKEKGILTWQLGQKVLDKLEHIGEATEMAPRVAYYDYLVRPKDKGGRGLDSKTAAWEAVNLVNFSRSGAGNGFFGSALVGLIPMVPFLNARVQGLYRLIENGTDGGKTDLFGRPIAKEAWFGTKGGAVGISKAIVSRGLMLTAIEMALNVIVGDEEWYEKLSVEDKVRNNYIQVAGVVVALPRAFEIGSIFGAVPALVMDAFRQRDGAELATGLGVIATQTFLFNAMPQAVKPLVEVYFANKESFTGREIETLADKRRPENERADEYTSELATALAQLLPGTSPKQADVLVRGYLGTMGTTFAAVSDSLFSSAGSRPQGAFGDPTSFTGTLANASGLSRFVKDPELMRNKFVKEFYNMKQDLTEIATSMNDAAERQDIEALKKKLEADPKAKVAYSALNRAASRITDLNKQIDNIRNNPNLTAEVKTTRLKQLRDAKNTVATNAYKMGKELGY